MRRGSWPAALALVSWACAASLTAAEKLVPTMARLRVEPASPQRSLAIGPEVVADADGSLRLARSVLVADETGATDFRQTEALSERVWAKKVFYLDSADVTSAEIYLYGEASRISVNGAALAPTKPLASTAWARADVPNTLLRAGANEVVLSGGGSLLIEPCRQPGHSLKSTDGGRTWSAKVLGKNEDLEGEYLIRLRLGRYSTRGRVLTPVIDVWDCGTAPGELPAPATLVRLGGLDQVATGQSAGTAVAVLVRTGTTPTPGPETWTAWQPVTGEHRPAPAQAGHRWAQLRFDLSTTRPQATPRLRPFWLDVQRTTPTGPARAAGRARVEKRPDTALPPASVPFAYQAPSPRLKLLRERYGLDKVIAPGKTEMEQLMLLRWWVRNQWHTAWQGGAEGWMPPWDSLVILESKDQPDCLTMCTHYACVFTQCCQALGWNARHCILDHHCVSEVWVDQHARWVVMDTGNSAERSDVGLHYERDGVPLSAREVQEVYRSGKTDNVIVRFTPMALAEKIAPLCRPAPKPKTGPVPRPDTASHAELKKYPVCQTENYRRYAFPARNTFLDSLYPGEREQGFSSYFYDGYWWVGDDRDAPKTAPEYTYHLPSSRPQDIDWPLNQAYAYLCATATPGEVHVDVDTSMPNLDHVERAEGDGKAAWAMTPATFTWKLRPGRNVLRVRGVNAWGRAGQEARTVIEWDAGKKDKP